MITAGARTAALALLALALARCADAGPAPSLATCRDGVRQNPESLESYACFRSAAHFDGSFEEAAAQLRAILQRNPGNVLAGLVLADLDGDRGPGREDAYREVADRAAAKNDRATEALALIKLSSVLLRRQRANDAESCLERARAAAAAAGSYWPAAVETAGSRIAYTRGDYAQAMILLRNAESRLFPDAPADLRASWLGALGATSWSLAHMTDADAAYRRQAKLLHDAGDRFEESMALVDL
ncbi:MAG TPA: hypothetical protein VKE50_04700, partial [Thermoanaerobaculia bacterium]|nr:hypothetical protein [Thermoanaerobaculia bacterium]